MAHSIIQKSQLEGQNRLDAEFYHPDKLDSLKILNRLKGENLKNYFTNVSEVITPFSKEEINNLKVYDLTDALGFFLEEGKKITSPLELGSTKKILQQNDVVISRLRSYLKEISIVKDEKAFGSTEFIVLRSIKEVVPEILFIYLLSNKIQVILNWSQDGTNHPRFNEEALMNLTLPNILLEKDKEIKKGVRDAFLLSDKSRELYQQAENLLLEKLGLKNFQFENDLFFTTKLSEVKSVNRIDADYFMPKYETILDRISQKGIRVLADNFDIIRSKNFVYKEGGVVGVIKTKQVGKQNLKFEVESETSQEISEKEKLPIMKDNDVVFASMGVGSLGRSNIFYDFEKNEREFTIDSTLRIFRKKTAGKILPEVLNVYLNSIVGQELIYKNIVGSSGIISIYEDYLRNLPVPLLSEFAQQKIADLVRKSHESRKKSKQLLGEAKRKVEELIESGI